MSQRTTQLRKDPDYLGRLFAEKGYVRGDLFGRVADLFNLEHMSQAGENEKQYLLTALESFEKAGGKFHR